VKLESIDGVRGSAKKYLVNLKESEVNSFWLKVFSKFTLLRVRMKISYQAILKEVTIQELFWQGILHTIVKIEEMGFVKKSHL